MRLTRSEKKPSLRGMRLNLDKLGIEVKITKFNEIERGEMLKELQDFFPKQSSEFLHEEMPRYRAIAFFHCPKMSIVGYGMNEASALTQLYSEIEEIATLN